MNKSGCAHEMYEEVNASKNADVFTIFIFFAYSGKLHPKNHVAGRSVLSGKVRNRHSMV